METTKVKDRRRGATLSLPALVFSQCIRLKGFSFTSDFNAKITDIKTISISIGHMQNTKPISVQYMYMVVY